MVLPDSFYITFVPEIPMDFDTDILSEIQDSSGEIFDIPELRDDEDFNLNEYINGNIDY